MVENKKLCFVGAGAMAEAIISGLLKHKLVKPDQVTVTNQHNHRRLEELTDSFGVSGSHGQHKEQAIREADILILAMKPKDVAQAITAIREWTREDQLMISVVAGISTTEMSKLLGHHAPIIRTMPNTSAVVGYSASGLCAGRHARAKHIRMAERIFEAIGIVMTVKEEEMDAITGLAGSGPAYLYYIVEALIKGGEDVGLSYEAAKRLTYQNVCGVAQMLLQTELKPEELRANVTSPNGTTAKGIETLQAYQVEKAVRQCVQKATERSKQLGEQFSAENHN